MIIEISLLLLTALVIIDSIVTRKEMLNLQQQIDAVKKDLEYDNFVNDGWSGN